MEWWMRRRQLPSQLRQRVRHFEHQRWAMMGGEDEMELVKDLPEGLRRDIKRFLCLDLIKKVQYKANSYFPFKNTKLVNITSGNILMSGFHHFRFLCSKVWMI